MRATPLQSGAKGLVSGTVTSGATWIESFEIDENGAEITDADTSTWKFVFKHCDSGNPVLTLTSGSEITVTQNTTSTIFAIHVDVSNMCGDYRADLAQQTPGGDVVHWASGTVTFIQENLGF
ncbi:hypothetical protein QIH93_15085 [Bradyrhizobium ottawaense]|uniref:hypothetical protein n=1 Tax=Bradyrhizobium ottawaense TaxID=931866 RepID=UPI0027149EB3|nr:hypothetical protein [Bradyrhizobium ottawaense]WLB49237.1 hypothetical protein QIH93_15085 [Bradyrhizobium ottawaense]